MTKQGTNHKNPEDARASILSYVENRLEEWAWWSRRGVSLGLGYPSRSLEYRLMREGHLTREPTAPRLQPTHASAEEMELLLCEMTLQHHKMAKVIRCYYLHSGGIRYQAQQLHMSHTHFEMHLNLGRWWLAGRLSATAPIQKLMEQVRRMSKSPMKKIIEKTH